jgi:menaquinol-cytochrome c reductase iron-sulfur subunit
MATPDRRGFLKLFAGLLGAAAAAMATVPVLGAVLTPLLRKKEDDTSLIQALPEKELVVGLPRRVELVSTVVDGWSRAVGVVGAVWLLKGADGKVSALSSICPHSGCSIGQQSKDTYSCPCHKSLFALDGTPQEGPSPRPMDPLSVEVKDGTVWVKWVKYKIGVKERRVA